MSDLSFLDPYNKFLTPTYSNLPLGRYVHFLFARHMESEAIFRTEGTGEPLSRELVSVDGGETTDERIVITKRKQTAVERRTGRELLRQLGLIRNIKAKKKGKGEQPCLLNSNEPCERCIDCFVYGFAAGGGGAQRSRVYTEDSYSLLSASEITNSRTGNATYDNSTMRHPMTGKPSQALFESEYVKPGSIFLDVQTLKDVQPEELLYILGNVLRSSRYGAIGTRIGKVRNQLLGVIFTTHEVISNLEWTQATWKALSQDGVVMSHPLQKEKVESAAIKEAQKIALRRVMGPHKMLFGHECDIFTQGIQTAYQDPSTWLTVLAERFDAIAGSFKE